MTDFSQVTLQAEQRNALLDELAAYAETDMLCYFAEEPKLYARQIEHWEPVLKWLEQEWGVSINRTKGVMPIEQPQELTQCCREMMAQYDDAALVAMAQIVTRLGSALLAVALELNATTLDGALAAAALDEEFQSEEWGEDEDISARLQERAGKVGEAHAYLLALGEAA